MIELFLHVKYSMAFFFQFECWVTLITSKAVKSNYAQRGARDISVLPCLQIIRCFGKLGGNSLLCDLGAALNVRQRVAHL